MCIFVCIHVLIVKYEIYVNEGKAEETSSYMLRYMYACVYLSVSMCGASMDDL
jgi:hypothetical protein